METPKPKKKSQPNNTKNQHNPNCQPYKRKKKKKHYIARSASLSPKETLPKSEIQLPCHNPRHRHKEDERVH